MVWAISEAYIGGVCAQGQANEHEPRGIAVRTDTRGDVWSNVLESNVPIQS